MLRPVRAGIAIVALIVTCSSALGQNHSSSQSLSENEYSVFSAFLIAQFHPKLSADDLRVGVPGSVLAPSTLPWASPISRGERKAMEKVLIGLEGTTLEDFEGCSTSSKSFTRKLSIPVAYQIASPEQISSVVNLLASFPSTWGYIRFSCAGFNPSHTQALFFVEREMCRGAVGKFVLMEKEASGNWLIKGQLLRWIS
jgi:hypothetical protein